MDLMTYALCKGNGGGGSSNKFIVTLTPTNPNFSGVMDKTVGEIRNAYNAGMDIMFKVMVGEEAHTVNTHIYVGGDGYSGFIAYLILGGLDMLICADTGHPPQDSWSNYGVTAYTLTPVS